jgi:hypothetical protein
MDRGIDPVAPVEMKCGRRQRRFGEPFEYVASFERAEGSDHD